MPEYGADYLRRLDKTVAGFETAFEDWMKTQVGHTTLESRGLMPTVWTKDGQNSAKVQGLELKVAEAAGLAARAVAVTGAYMNVQGYGLVDPIANWALMSSPRALFGPNDIRMTSANVRGRLGSMLADAEARTDSSLPSFSPAQLHEVVWASAAAHWTTHQYRVAVREAAEALTVHWKEKIGRNDVDDTVFWQQTLSAGDPSPGRPKLAWPGESTDKTTRSMRGGLEPLASSLKNLAVGLNLTVRNVATHTRGEFSEQEAMERLSAYSYLARLLDQCEIRRVDEVEASTPVNVSM